MYRMAMLAQTLSPIPNCDMDKVVRMCLVHDLAECRVGDITPHDNVPVDVKHEMERTAITGLTALLNPAAGSALMQLYHEYEQHESVESKLTKDLDIFDFVHQAFVYEKQAAANGASAHSLQLDHFVQTAHLIQNPQVKRLADRLLADRQQFLLNQEPGTGVTELVTQPDSCSLSGNGNQVSE